MTLLSDDWFMLGVVISFAGASLDNTYWGVAWHLHYIQHPAAQDWFDSGAVSNLPFRQACTWFAALCHVKAAHMHSSKLTTSPRAVVCWSIGLAVVYGGILSA